MLTDGLMLSLLVSLLLSGLAYKTKNLAICFISSLGWLIAGMEVYEQTSELLPMGLIMMVAFAQFLLLSNSKGVN